MNNVMTITTEMEMDVQTLVKLRQDTDAPDLLLCADRLPQPTVVMVLSTLEKTVMTKTRTQEMVAQSYARLNQDMNAQANPQNARANPLVCDSTLHLCSTAGLST